MRHELALALALALSLGLAAHAAAADAGDRLIEGAAPAGTATRLELEAGVGEVRVEVASDDQVHWRVTLEADPNGHGIFSRRSPIDRIRADLDRVAVIAVPRGNGFRIELDTPSSLDDDDFKQRWVVSVPARFAAKVGVDVGELKVRGIAGGVEAEVDVGDIEIDVPTGAIEASVDVGDIELRLGNGGSGEIDLGTDVGDVELELAGRRIRSDGGYGPGESLRLSGKGGPGVKLRVDVGDIEVVIDR